MQSRRDWSLQKFCFCSFSAPVKKNATVTELNYMNMQKVIIGSVFMSCIFLSCGEAINDGIGMQYDKKYSMLAIHNLESGRILKKIELHLLQDTLFISKVSKRFVLFERLVSFGGMSSRIFGGCMIKLQPNFKYVKLGDTLFSVWQKTPIFFKTQSKICIRGSYF